MTAKAWLQHKRNWAKKKPLVWANLILGTTTLTIIFLWPGPSDLRLRLLGLALQLLGILTVWHDLTSTAGKFGMSGIFRSLWVWLKEFSYKPRMVYADISEQVNAVDSARVKKRWTTKANASLAERVSKLEENFLWLDQDLSSMQQAIDRKTSELDSKINTHREFADSSIREVKERLKETATGNFPLLAFGAWWLAVGVFLATVAPEIWLMSQAR